MYEIRLDDGTNVYYQGDEDYTAYDIECVTQKGDAGSLEFTIPESNPMWKKLVTRKSVLEFVCDGESIGFFEVREINHDSRFSERVYAVGELSWLFDSIQPQAEFHNISPADFLRRLLAAHNAQCPEHQFSLGRCDVTDTNDSLYRYTNRETTLDCIREKLVDRLGGQVKLRRSGNTRYIDYLTDEAYGSESKQRIYFGENLLDYSDTLTADGICSEVVPLGARLENDAADNSTLSNLGKRLTVESVNGGSDYVSNASLVSRFGHVRTVQTWDDVTVASNLLAKARKWLADTQFEQMHLSVKAVDLSLASTQFDRLRMGDTVRVVAEPYGLDKSFPITKRTYHPDAPDSDVIELNSDEGVSYVSSQAAARRAASTAVAESERNGTQWLVGSMANANAMMTGSNGGCKRTEYDRNGKWVSESYLRNEQGTGTVRKVDRNGTSFSEGGIDGAYRKAYTYTDRFYVGDVKTVYDSSGKEAGFDITPIFAEYKFIDGSLVDSNWTWYKKQTLPFKSYVDGIVPQGAKTRTYTHEELEVSGFTETTDGREMFMNVRPCTVTEKYEDGMLVDKTITTKESKSLVLSGSIPSFSLSGSTLTIRLPS